MTNPSRLQSALDFASAAMYMLIFGSITEELRNELVGEPAIPQSLREEFDSIYQSLRDPRCKPHRNQKVYKLFDPEFSSLGECSWAWKGEVNHQIDCLLHMRQRPSVVVEALKAEFGSEWTPGQRIINNPIGNMRAHRVAAAIQLDIRHLYFVARQDVDFDEKWCGLRAILQEVAKGGAQ